MNIRDFIKNNIVYLDGGMGTLLQKSGLQPGELPEHWNISHPEVIREIHKNYYDSGSNVVNTNTFGANTLKFSIDELDEIICHAVKNADEARKASSGEQEKFIALDVGPTGKLLKPLGDLDFEDAVKIFAETIRLGVKYGVDLITIETMNDSYETKAAVLAAKENSDLPIIVTNAYGENGRLMTGANPAVMAAMLEGMGVDAIGANCSLGPKQLMDVMDELLKYCSVPVAFKPNAGLPKSDGKVTYYDVDADEFAQDIKLSVENGVRIVGGCCGTTPEYIKKVCELTRGMKPKEIEKKTYSVCTSYNKAVFFGEKPILIGERINPTGKKRFKQALLENDIGYILQEAVNQQAKGVHVLDVNVGLPGIDEAQMLTTSVCELQCVTDLPLQIDSSDPVAMESALRRYNGKAMINSVNGKEENMNAIFPLVKKYGGFVVALTLDEKGIPSTVEGRMKIARKILLTAALYGINKKDIIFDPLAMTVSADKMSAVTTLETVKKITEQLGCNTSLGVSNVSFGLPSRELVNAAFFTTAMENGLSAAIMNPYSARMMEAYYSFNVVKGLDDNCMDFINFASQQEVQPTVKHESSLTLKEAIEKGLKEKSSEITTAMLGENAPLDIVNSHVIPALDDVGKRFEEKKLFLPQLLMSAEAAKASFEVIKAAMAADGNSVKKGNIVIATVHGDIHDIGKNIVKLLLENYGYNVIDLGKNVPPETILNAVIENHAPIVGLSALMTTTVPAMEETVKLVKEKAPWCKTVVGGAVLTQDYADKIGADKYAADAMESVRYAETVIG
ncbi:b12 binding domain./Pterin binding enzyme./Homocysteine S-methyltransferase [Ruminococcus sp. CAG:563]|nr:b12 binding domain./Pterin binding enzyme./Homocysteine S-methyltransferase [Ruminococcus sp. CAG:563]